MKCLFLDCNRFQYELDHPTPAAEAADQSSAIFENAMVVFVCVESHDGEETINPAAKEIRKLCRKANARHVVINPFAHLSTELASAEIALALTKGLVSRIKESWDGEVSYTSFGWYKRFILDVAGHDNSQIWRAF